MDNFDFIEDLPSSGINAEVGNRIRLIYMDDPNAVEPGTEGTVTKIDDMGQIHVKWDNDRSLAIIPNLDEYEIINEINEGNLTDKVMNTWRSSIMSSGKVGEYMKHGAKLREDKVEGGLADGMSSNSFKKDQLIKGVKVEMEHTNDPSIALEIAKDHLLEDPLYYDKLEKIHVDEMTSTGGSSGVFVGKLKENLVISKKDFLKEATTTRNTGSMDDSEDSSWVDTNDDGWYWNDKPIYKGGEIVDKVANIKRANWKDANLNVTKINEGFSNKRKAKPFKKVMTHDTAVDYNGEELMVMDKGKLKDLENYDSTGALNVGGYPDKNELGIAVQDKYGQTHVYTYGEDSNSAIVYESVNEGKKKKEKGIHKEKWKRCVKKVKNNSPDVNPYAVCTDSIGYEGSIKKKHRRLDESKGEINEGFSWLLSAAAAYSFYKFIQGLRGKDKPKESNYGKSNWGSLNAYVKEHLKEGGKINYEENTWFHVFEVGDLTIKIDKQKKTVYWTHIVPDIKRFLKYKPKKRIELTDIGYDEHEYTIPIPISQGDIDLLVSAIKQDLNETTTTSSVGNFQFVGPLFAARSNDDWKPAQKPLWNGGKIIQDIKSDGALVKKDVLHEINRIKYVKGGEFMKIDDKCRKFPYCNQGAIDKPIILMKNISDKTANVIPEVAKMTGKTIKEVCQTISKTKGVELFESRQNDMIDGIIKSVSHLNDLIEKNSDLTVEVYNEGSKFLYRWKPMEISVNGPVVRFGFDILYPNEKEFQKDTRTRDLNDVKMIEQLMLDIRVIRSTIENELDGLATDITDESNPKYKIKK